MPQIKISDLTEYTNPQPADIAPVVEVASGTTKKTKLSSLIASFLPPGIIVPYGAAAAPANWLLCDGSEVSRATYAALFAAIGTTYGAGDGSSTFTLPDLRGRVPVGKSSETEFNTLGETGGEKRHQLTVGELASHTHTVGIANQGFAQDYASLVPGSNFGVYSSDPLDNFPTGGNEPHNNLQPYITLNYIIKV